MQGQRSDLPLDWMLRYHELLISCMYARTSCKHVLHACFLYLYVYIYIYVCVCVYMAAAQKRRTRVVFL